MDLSMKPLVPPFHRTPLEDDVNAVVQSDFQIRPTFSLDLTQRDSSSSKNDHLSSLEIKQFKCDECLKTFANKKYLSRHKKRHGKKIHACSICPKNYAVRNDLQRHEKSHLVPTHQCDICSKMCISESRLTIHRAIHFEKSFECELCNKKFHSDSNLISHRKIHFNFLNQYSVCKLNFI